MDLDDDEQEQAAKAKRKLKRRSKKKSAKAKNAAGAAPHAPEQERNAFLERIQAEEVRREQARIAAARPVPPPPNRATGAGDDSDEGWEESDEDDPVEDLIHRERIRERDLLRTPGCLALGRKAFRLEDMPRVTERPRDPAAPPVAGNDLGPSTRAIASFDAFEGFEEFAFSDAATRRRNCGELEVPRAEWANSELGDTMTTEAIRARFDLRRDDGVFFLRLQRLFPNLNFRLSWSVRFNVVVQTIDAIALDSNLELTRVDMEVRRSTVGVYEDSLACQLLGQTYYVHPDKTIKITVDLVVTSEVIGAFPRRPPFPRAARSLDDGHLIVELKYLQAMHAEGEYQLALSNYRQMELWCFFKAAEARGETFVPTPYDETAVDAVVVTAVPPVAPVVSAPAGPPLKALEAMTRKELSAELDAAGVPKAGRAVKHTAIEVLCDLVRRLRAGEPAASLKVPEAQATLVADGAKKVSFDSKRKDNGYLYLIERFRASRRRTRCASKFDELARATSPRRRPTSRPWTGSSAPDPGLVNLPTIWPRMRFPSAATR
ncbi:hypothetical protein JL720_15729 [Aureococcus anophagefferens]|nr:hypothetical protein JL720_15729 [Aureococcus anophagefferens]